MPRRPRSPELFTVNETNGVGRSALFLMTRSLPACSATNRRPSGANAIAVGAVRPPAICVSVKPAGKVAAVARWAPKNTRLKHRILRIRDLRGVATKAPPGTAALRASARSHRVSDGRPPSRLRRFGETDFAKGAYSPAQTKLGAAERSLAEREGFEPSVGFPLHTLSKRAP